MRLPFDAVHQRENNPLSQAFLDEHREKFNRDCFNVLVELVSGKRLSYKYAIDIGLSGDIRARIRDLRKIYGIPVSDEWITTANERRYKEYYMTEADKARGMEVLLTKIQQTN